jgi:hypothetical protein
MNTLREKPFATPLLVLVLLLVLSATRWDYKVTKSFDGDNPFTVRWKEDNWTGCEWLEVYAIAGVSEYIPNGVEQEQVDFDFALRRDLTYIWWMLFVGNILYLTIVLLKGVKRSAANNCENLSNNNVNDNGCGV